MKAKLELPKVSFATTCMGRSMHVQETLIKNIQDNRGYPRLEVVLLDYNSGDGLEQWVRDHCRQWIEEKILFFYRTTEPKFFHRSHAKNVAHLLASGDVVVNVDADNWVGRGFAQHLGRLFAEHPVGMCRCGRSGDGGAGGRIAVSRAEFIGLGGYEEQMLGWGYEDGDLSLRGRRSGLPYRTLDPSFCRCIDHTDELREKHETPPGQPTLTKALACSRNSGLFERRRDSADTIANAGRIWGKAFVQRNFRHMVKVGERAASPADLLAPPPEAVQPPKKAVKGVGVFRISRSSTRQVNAPEAKAGN
jgi:hypothetical protein